MSFLAMYFVGRWVSNVKGHDCIVCPYHGWAFDKEGTLKDVPAAEHSDEWPKKPILDGYHVEEKVTSPPPPPPPGSCWLREGKGLLWIKAVSREFINKPSETAMHSSLVARALA